MKASSLRSMVKNARVKPVNIRLVDGTKIQVTHPKTCGIATPANVDNEGVVIVWEGEEAPYFFELEAIAAVSQQKKRINNNLSSIVNRKS